MNVASLELCKELYELSGWDNGTNWHDPKDPQALLEYPRYDLGYLLRKLPENTLLTWNREDGAIVYYSTWTFTGGVFTEGNGWSYKDDFENATAKLAIELFKKGILTKDKTDE